MPSIPSLVCSSGFADATLQESVTKAHASIMPQLAQLAKNMLRELDPNDELTHLRVRSAKREVMVAARASRVHGRQEDTKHSNVLHDALRCMRCFSPA